MSKLTEYTDEAIELLEGLGGVILGVMFLLVGYVVFCIPLLVIYDDEIPWYMGLLAFVCFLATTAYVIHRMDERERMERERAERERVEMERVDERERMDERERVYAEKMAASRKVWDSVTPHPDGSCTFTMNPSPQHPGGFTVTMPPPT